MFPFFVEVLRVISGGVKLLVDLVAKVGMDRGDELVLLIHLLAGEYFSVSFRFGNKEVADLISLYFIEIQHTHGHGRGPYCDT